MSVYEKTQELPAYLPVQLTPPSSSFHVLSKRQLLNSIMNYCNRIVFHTACANDIRKARGVVSDPREACEELFCVAIRTRAADAATPPNILRRELLREVRCVHAVDDIWQNRRLHLFLLKQAPIDVLEEDMLLDGLHTLHLEHRRLAGTKTLVDISLQQLLQDRVSLRAKPLGQRKLHIYDIDVLVSHSRMSIRQR